MAHNLALWLKQIPRGKVTTYKELARVLRASPRAVGRMCSSNPDAPRVPCHRVVCSDGRIGGYTHPQGVQRKIELLERESVEIRRGRINLDKFFHGFSMK